MIQPIENIMESSGKVSGGGTSGSSSSLWTTVPGNVGRLSDGGTGKVNLL